MMNFNSRGSSGNHDPDAYAVAIRLAHEAANIVDDVYAAAADDDSNGCSPDSTSSSSRGRRRRCKLLDIGGGYPGRDGVGGDVGRFSGSRSSFTCDDDENESAETALKISETVMPVLRELYPQRSHQERGSDDDCVRVIAEPGRYFVEAAFALCSRIYRVRVDSPNRRQGYSTTSGDGGGSGSSSSEAEAAATNRQEHRHYYIAQGVQSLFKDCILCGESFTPIPFRVYEENCLHRDGESLVLSTVHGPSGDEADVVCRNHLLPRLEVGDWLLFDRMGAYSLSISARCFKPPIRYVIGGQHE